MRGYATMIKVLFICHGNICRSTMSQSVFTYLVRQAGLEDCFEIDSAATSRGRIMKILTFLLEWILLI